MRGPTLDEVRVRTECHSERQADVVIETLRRLECWPSDFTLETDPFELPGGWVLVCCGATKGRSYAFGVDPEGGVSA
jgi:hypothetical protein